MGFGTQPTVIPAQEMYAALTMQNMNKWLGPTTERLTELSSSPMSTYEPIADWNKYIGRKYVEPAGYTLKQRLANLQHSNERFSFGRQFREMSLMNQMNQGLGSSIMGELGQERELQYRSQANALSRQLQSLGVEGQSIFAPLQIKTQESAAKPVALFESMFKSLFGG